MLAVIIFILILGVLIFVHEAGHFFMARRNGIKAEEFGFGFPPRIFGLQRRSGEGTRVLSRKEDVAVEVSSEKIGKTEVVRELALDRIREIVENFSIKKWRFIWGKRNTPEEILNQENLNEGTIYSLNWIPLGGFVKIKGEDGEGKNDADSFAAKNAWVRVKVLAAGVMMNFVLAWVLLSLVFMLGAPEAIDSAADRKIAAESKIQIAEVVASSPADKAGIKIGDEIVKNQGGVVFSSLNDVQQYINSKKGEEINLKIKRGRENLEVKVVPRTNAPEGEGALGIGFLETALVRYPWYLALWKGLVAVFDLITAMLLALFQILKNLFLGEAARLDVAGPVGIAVLTKQVATLGIVYVLQFAAILSINLGIINALPFPALDGGRILFILIEKIKGSPVSQKTEQLFHTVGFLLLILLMLVVTFKDISKFIK